MSPFMILAFSLLIVSIVGLIYLLIRISRFSWVRRVAGEHGVKKYLLSFLLMAVTAGMLYLCMGVVNLVVCILHILVIWILSDLFFLVLNRFRRKQYKIYAAGLFAVLFSACYLTMGWYVAHHVVETDYALDTDKELGEEALRVVMFADAHVGATFHADRFRAYCREIENLEPDVLLVAGDFVDDDTTKEDMLACCQALGNVRTRYGTYFVYGNHDRGYFPPAWRGYSGDDLAAELVKNGIVILKDESVLIDDRFYLIGREDAGNPGRADMETLLKGLDTSKYMIVLDHQPHDYTAQEASHVDLVLSGHTHGGWLFPFNRVAEWMGVDDKTYGREKRTDTEFIVTSGISEWALKFKTGTISEYVVLTIKETGGREYGTI